MSGVEWGNPNWGEPGHNVHVNEGGNFLDAEPAGDDQ